MAGKKNDYVTKLLAVLGEYGKTMDGEGTLLVEEIRALLGKGLNVSAAVDAALKQRQYSDFVAKSVTDSIYKMALAGYGISPAIRVDVGAQQRLTKKLTGTAWTGDKMKLSTRLHGTNKAIRETIVSTIQTSINRQEGLRKLSMQLYDGYHSGKKVISPADLPEHLKRLYGAARSVAAGDKAAMEEFEKAFSSARDNLDKLASRNVTGTPNTNLKTTYENLIKEAKKLVSATGKLNATALDNAVWSAVQEKSRYYADRISRTENARAWFDGFILETQNDELVWGYRWVLSNRHKYVPFDQCDVCANMDLGYGKGIYPKDKVPSIPRHPHCMCSLEVVYYDEIDPSAVFDPNGARKYIDSLTDQEREDLFGAAGAKAYQQGDDWQKWLRGWDGFRQPVSRLKVRDMPVAAAPTREEQLTSISNQKWRSLLKPKDWKEVRKILETATDTELNFWAKYGAMVDGEFYYDRGAHFSPRTQKVNLNIGQVDDRMKRIKGTSNTRVFFHETGHLFDYMVIRKSSGKRLADVLVKLKAKLKADYTDYANRLFIERGMKPITGLNRLSPERKQILHRDLQRDRNLKNSISDIVEGLTDGRVGGILNYHYGHGKAYWDNPQALVIEAIAHIFEASMMKGERLEIIKQYFPNAYTYVKAEFDRLGV
ncbi:hypothetical protein [Anaerospora hongkongensis]|uniref:hypothetical protein n=1 Tax=Anaerospora hongkongensis TaxID=244830 RepID=UPI0028A26363|nr:hypothetical protein [Anaerospora hongkongensis]